MAQIPGYAGDVYVESGGASALTTVPIGTGDGSERDFYLIEELDDCEAAGDFAVTDFDSVATDAAVFKENTKSIKALIGVAVGATNYKLTYDPAGQWDWSKRSWFGMWFHPP